MLVLGENEANAGHFSPRRQTNMRKLRLSCREKEKFETLKGFGGVTGLINHCFKQEKENQLVVTTENNEPNPKLTEIVVGE